MKKRNRHSLLDSKDGQWLQLTFVVVVLMVLGILYVVLSKFSSDINDAIQLEPDMSNESKVLSESHTASTPFFFDGITSIVLVGVWLLCLGLAYNSGSSPMLLVVGLLIVVALGFVSMILSNTWESLSNDAEFSSTASKLPFTSFYLNHYLVVVLAMGFSTLAIGLSRGGGF